MSSEAVPLPPKKPWRKRRSFPAPEWSSCLYVQLRPDTVHLFRFFLEAYDNLALMTVVDRWAAVLKIRFSPHQEAEARQALAEMAESMELRIIDLSSRTSRKPC